MALSTSQWVGIGGLAAIVGYLFLSREKAPAVVIPPPPPKPASKLPKVTPVSPTGVTPPSPAYPEPPPYETPSEPVGGVPGYEEY